MTWAHRIPLNRIIGWFNQIPCFLLCFLLLFASRTTYGQGSWIVHSIEFHGNYVFSANQLAVTLMLKRGDVFQESAFTNNIEHVLALYQKHAYLYSRIDSIQIRRDTLQQEADISIYLFEGKPSIIRHVDIEGCSASMSLELKSVIQLHEGDPFIASTLEQDIQAILQHYEHNGYALTKVSVQNIEFTDSAMEMSVSIKLQINEGQKLYISEMRIEGNKTTKDYVVLREARLRSNELFRDDLPERIKRRLEHLQLFSSVSLPELYVTETGQAGLLVRIVEGKQNSFDGVLGYTPSQQADKSGSITGLINISLRNLFGTGRKISARWYQENADSRETELHYFEPWIASYPINAQLGFLQRKQDSTYVRLQYDLAVEFMLTEEFSLGASFMQNNIFPTERYDGGKAIAESKTTGFGASIRYDSRDNPTTPTSGILYTTEYQTGTKHTTSSNTLNSNSESTTRRLSFDLSFYHSPFLRQVIAAELHLRDFSSDQADVSDLFRIGGAATLRGYREGFFLGSRLVWTNLEYRLLVAPRSYFYGFVDIGYIVQPSFASINLQASEQTKTGYGIGVRMDSALGLIGVSFAFGEGDTFSTSKIHIRLINEF